MEILSLTVDLEPYADNTSAVVVGWNDVETVLSANLQHRAQPSCLYYNHGFRHVSGMASRPHQFQRDPAPTCQCGWVFFVPPPTYSIVSNTAIDESNTAESLDPPTLGLFRVPPPHTGGFLFWLPQKKLPPPNIAAFLFGFLNTG